MKTYNANLLAILSFAPSCAFAYFNTAFLQVDTAGQSKITAFDDEGKQKTLSLALTGFKAVGLDQNVVNGDIYVLGIKTEAGGRQCQVFTVNSKGSTSSPFRSFQCNLGNPRDIEVISGEGEHVIPNGSTAYHYDPATKEYETYRFVYAAGDQSAGTTPDIVAISEPAEGLIINGAHPSPLALDAGKGRQYANLNYSSTYQTRGFTVTWNPETDINTSTKNVVLHTVGPANIPDATGQNNSGNISNSGVLTDAVSLDQGASGQVHIFYVGVPYNNPYGFGDRSQSQDTYCPGNSAGDFSGSLGNSNNSADGTGSPDSIPGFMALCDHPSENGLSSVVAVADLSKATADDDTDQGGGGSIDPFLLLPLLALGLVRLRPSKKGQHVSLNKPSGP